MGWQFLENNRLFHIDKGDIEVVFLSSNGTIYIKNQHAISPIINKREQLIDCFVSLNDTFKSKILLSNETIYISFKSKLYLWYQEVIIANTIWSLYCSTIID